MIDLCDELRRAIRCSGLTRKQIADASGVSYSLVHGFVAGRGLTLKNASRIGPVVGVKGLKVGHPPKRARVKR